MKKKIKQRMRKVLARVINHYRANPAETRCYDPDEGQCVYSRSFPGANNMRHCAVGLHLKQEIKDQGSDWHKNGESLWDISYPAFQFEDHNGHTEPAPDLDAMLDDKYTGLPYVFWARLQELHDDEEHWRESDDSHREVESKPNGDGVDVRIVREPKGLTELGRTKIKRIKEELSLCK